MSLERGRLVLRYATSLVTTPVPIFRTIRWMLVGEAKRAPGSDRCVLPHCHIFTGSECNPRPGRTPPRARLGHRILAPVVDALCHVTNDPDVTAQLIIRLVLAEWLHFSTVHAKIHVPHAPTLPVITGVRVDHLDEVRVAAVQPVHVSGAYEGSGRV